MFKNKILNLGNITFILLYLSLFIGFFFNEESSGSGGFINDFNNTWPYVKQLQEDLFTAPSKWRLLHPPLHFILLSKINYILVSKEEIRLFFCAISVLVPILFYECLKIKFPEIKKEHLLIFASTIFIFPAFRSGAIWANDHITSLIFFLVFLFYFLKWLRSSDFLKLNYLIYYQLFFLALACYCRQYYVLIYLYLIYIYFKKFDLVNLFKILLIAFILSLPGFILIYFDPAILRVSFDARLHNTYLISSSMISLYIIPIFFTVFFINKSKLEYPKSLMVCFILSTILIFILSKYFQWNWGQGGGLFFKGSYLLFGNNIVFLISAIFGSSLLFYLIKENSENIYLIILLLIGFSSYKIHQKYFEPWFIMIMFLMIKTSITNNFLKKISNIIFLKLFFIVYLFVAIINYIFQITNNYEI
jgi:hypothetical protein